MKILKYGPLTLTVDLDSPGEEIFMDQLQEIIRRGEADFKWRQQNHEALQSLNETHRKGKIIQEPPVKSKKQIVKKSVNKNRKVKA